MFPVAFAVPKRAGLVLRPERVFFTPNTVVERYMLFTRGSRTRRKPTEIGKSVKVVFLHKILPLCGSAAAGDTGIVFGGLIAVESIQDGFGYGREIFFGVLGLFFFE